MGDSFAVLVKCNDCDKQWPANIVSRVGKPGYEFDPADAFVCPGCGGAIISVVPDASRVHPAPCGGISIGIKYGDEPAKGMFISDDEIKKSFEEGQARLEALRKKYPELARPYIRCRDCEINCQGFHLSDDEQSCTHWERPFLRE